MSRNARLTVVAAIALVLAGTSYLMSAQSTANGGLSKQSRIDAFALMVAAKELPRQHFDAY
jgi:hypothetical protein